MRNSNRLSKVVLNALLLFLVFVGAANASYTVNFGPNIRITLYAPSTEQWIQTTFTEAKPGGDFIYNNQLYHVTDSGKAQAVSGVEIAKLIDADLPYDDFHHRRPKAGDVVQVLDKDMAFSAHAAFSSVPPPANIRFQGKAYSLKADRSLVDAKKTFSPATNTLQHIEITKSATQHITDRHTPGGAKNAGASTFNSGENIQALIKSAEFSQRVLEPNGYYKREFDIGRNIGYQGSKQTSTLRVITAKQGQLVTAYPVVKRSGGKDGN